MTPMNDAGWRSAAAVSAYDSTRIAAGELSRYDRILIRTDAPPAQPVVWRRPRRERLLICLLRLLLALYAAAVLALVLLAGAVAAHWLADAAVRLIGGN